MQEDSTGGPTSSAPTSSDHHGDEMTVVVPPAKGSRLSASENQKDQEGDVAMEGAEEEAQETEPQVDPHEKTVQGECPSPSRRDRVDG